LEGPKFMFFSIFLLDLLVKGALLVQDYSQQRRIIEHISIHHELLFIHNGRVAEEHFIDSPLVRTGQCDRGAMPRPGNIYQIHLL